MGKPATEKVNEMTRKNLADFRYAIKCKSFIHVKNFFSITFCFLLTVAAATALCYSAALILDSAVELFSMILFRSAILIDGSFVKCIMGNYMPRNDIHI